MEQAAPANQDRQRPPTTTTTTPIPGARAPSRWPTSRTRAELRDEALPLAPSSSRRQRCQCDDFASKCLQWTHQPAGHKAVWQQARQAWKRALRRRVSASAAPAATQPRPSTDEILEACRSTRKDAEPAGLYERPAAPYQKQSQPSDRHRAVGRPDALGEVEGGAVRGGILATRWGWARRWCACSTSPTPELNAQKTTLIVNNIGAAVVRRVLRYAPKLDPNYSSTKVKSRRRCSADIIISTPHMKLRPALDFHRVIIDEPHLDHAAGTGWGSRSSMSLDAFALLWLVTGRR